MSKSAVWGVVGLAWGLAQAASAQPSQPTPIATANGAAYDQAFFAQYDSSNAEDMLRRIPGVQAILDSVTAPAQRGFGSGGARVLLAGRRFPGKANEIGAVLRRIPAASVERVELISGSSAEVEVQSEGVVVNIIMKPGAAIGAAGSWEANARFNGHDAFGLDGLASYTATYGPATINASLERNLWAPSNLGNARWTYRTREEAYYYPDGRLQEARPQVWRRENEKWIATGGLSVDGRSGDRLTLNGYYEYRWTVETDTTDLIRYNRAGGETLRARELHSRTPAPYHLVEVSGEYTSNLGPGALSSLFLTRRDWTPTTDYRDREEPARHVEVSRNEQDVRKQEDIVRASYTLGVANGQSVELGGEAARNALRQDLQTFADSNGDGVLEALELSIARAEVEETRGELFLTHRWRATSKLSLESSVNYEYSKLVTNYPLQPERTLSFLKPRLDVRYSLLNNSQVRLLLERTVSQLDFANFVPKYNATDDRIEAGNPALEPEKAWNLEAGFERRLANDRGLLEFRIFHSHITDAIDKAPLRDPQNALISASSNIGAATLSGFEGKASVRLTSIGLRDAMLSLRALRQWSEVEDPFNAARRRLATDRSFSYDVGLRHDLKALKASYGFTYRAIGAAAISSDLFVTEHHTVAPTLEVYIERRVSPSAVLRLEAQNLTGSPETRRRVLYAVNALDGVVRRRDFYREERDVRVAMRLRGRF